MPGHEELSRSSSRSLTMDHTITVALDRDAQHTVDLTLIPRGHLQKPTRWLLQHGIPATASLPLALQRLRAASDALAATPAEPADPTSRGSAPSSPVRLATSSPLASSPIGAVLVGYVVGEVHAYCLLISCQSPFIAAQVCKRLAREVAPGTAAPVDFVESDGVLSAHEAPATLALTAAARAATDHARTRLPLEQVIFSCCLSVQGGAFVPDEHASSLLRRSNSSPALSPKLPLAAVAAPRRSAAGAGLASGGDSPVPRTDSVAPRSPLMLPFSQAVPPALHEDCSICQTDALYTRPVVVTLCHHAFHMECYSKLVEGASDCPLCRFSLSDLQNDARCGVCGTFEDLWVCLVCGFTGCGRARLHHLQQHSQATGHSCAVQASTGRIWDAAAGLFLHQEVAIQLGEDDETRSATAAAATRQATWWADDHDEDLRAALTESKENAIAQFYVTVLQRLLSEQAAWVASGCPGLVAAETPATLSSSTSTPTDTAAAPVAAQAGGLVSELAALEREEAALRRSLVRLYVGELQALCAEQSILLSTLTKRNARQQRQVQELIMLQCHQNAGLKQHCARAAAQAEKLRASGKAEEAAKRKTLEQLEAQATQLLTNLS